MLTSTQVASKQLVWNPNASDSELIACLKDLIDAMATVTGSTIAWDPSRSEPPHENTSLRYSSSSTFGKKARSSSPALHLVCNCDEAMTDARVLQVVTPLPCTCAMHPAVRSFPRLAKIAISITLHRPKRR